MRRLLASAALVPILVLSLAAQAYALVTPGTQKILATANETCDSTGCTRTIVNVYTNLEAADPNGGITGPAVCSSEVRYDTSFVGLWQYWACESVNASAFILDSRGYVVGLQPTSLDQVETLYGSLPPRTVTVSVNASTSGRVHTETYKGEEPDGSCVNKWTLKNQVVNVGGTLTQDAATLPINYPSSSQISIFTVRQQCPH